MSDPGPVRAAMLSGRRGGKSLAYRRAVEADAMLGKHVHALARDGQWCVTWQPVGFVWARVR